MAVITPIAFVTTGTAALRLGRIVIVTLAPFVLIVVGYLVAFVASPNTHGAEYQTHYQTFFSSTAVVLATLLVTLVVQASLFALRGINTAALLGFFYIMCGEIAATLSLSPGLDPTVARHAFALTVSASAGALAAIFFIAFKLLAVEPYRVSATPDGAGTLEQSDVQTAIPLPAAKPSRRATGGTTAAAEPEIRLTPAAVRDLDDLGGLTSRTVGSLMENIFGNPTELAARSKRIASTDASGWYALPLGSLQAIYRPLTSDERTAAGDDVPGIMVARVIPRREAPAVVAGLSESSQADGQDS